MYPYIIKNLDIEYSDDPCGENHFSFDYYPENLAPRTTHIITYTEYYKDRFFILIDELQKLDPSLDISIFEIVPNSEHVRGYIHISGACKHTSIDLIIHYLNRTCDWVYRDYLFWRG